MSKTIRWGILGPGRIAHKFAEALSVVDGAELAAVASRSESRAQEFAAKHGAARAYEGYERLAQDDGVDAVYVASPHVGHEEHACLCLSSGKAVLCEKPISINAASSERMIQCAREHGVFLMEAMWTRFLPVTRRVCQWLADGAVGEVRLITADLGFRCGWNPESRLLNPDLGGGALLDVGVYTLAYASMVCGFPEAVTGEACIGATGVDEQAAYVLRYGDGALARLFCAVRTNTAQSAHIVGTKGQITVSRFWCQPAATLEPAKGDRVSAEQQHRKNGFEYEIEEVHRCLAEGRLESDLMPLDESLSVMRTADALRQQWGLTYPMEVTQ